MNELTPYLCVSDSRAATREQRSIGTERSSAPRCRASRTSWTTDGSATSN